MVRLSVTFFLEKHSSSWFVFPGLSFVARRRGQQRQLLPLVTTSVPALPAGIGQTGVCCGSGYRANTPLTGDCTEELECSRTFLI